MADEGYGELGDQQGFAQQGGSFGFTSIAQAVAYLQQQKAKGVAMTPGEQELLAHPDDYFLQSGHVTAKNFVNQHKALIIGAALAAIGGAGALAATGGSAASGGALASTQIGTGMVEGLPAVVPTGMAALAPGATIAGAAAPAAVTAATAAPGAASAPTAGTMAALNPGAGSVATTIPAGAAASPAAAAPPLFSVAPTASLFSQMFTPSSLVGQGINLAGNIIAQRGQNQAASEAAASATRVAEIQAQAQRDALAMATQQANAKMKFDQDVFNQRMAALAPYRNVGGNAITTLGAGYGLSSTASQGGNPPPINIPPAPLYPQAPGSAPTQAGPTAPPAPAPTSGPQNMVTIQAPDGTATKQVPASELQYWISKGARRLN